MNDLTNTDITERLRVVEADIDRLKGEKIRAEIKLKDVNEKKEELSKIIMESFGTLDSDKLDKISQGFMKELEALEVSFRNEQEPP